MVIHPVLFWVLFSRAFTVFAWLNSSKKIAALFFLAFRWLRIFTKGVFYPLHPRKPFEKGLCENFMFALF